MARGYTLGRSAEPVDNRRPLVYIQWMSADQFKELREKKGYSQAELARLLKVTVRTISRWENGDRRVPHIAIMALDSLSNKKGRR